MSYIFKLIKTNKIAILILIISSLLIYLLYRFIFWGYPDFIRNVYYDYICPTKEDDFSYNIGTFGDMYGGLNAFLSGLAFIGAVIAIILQVYQIDQERRKHKDEIKVQLNLFKWHIERLNTFYLPTLKIVMNADADILKTGMFNTYFNDEYSFRELEKVDILEIYKGFITLDKHIKANELITFFQQLKEVYEDYKTIVEFISSNSIKLGDLDNKLKIHKDRLFEKLLAFERIDLLNEIQKQDLIYSYPWRGENDVLIFDNLLDRLMEHSDYVKSIFEYNTHKLFFENSKSEKIARIDNITPICTTLSNAIPSI